MCFLIRVVPLFAALLLAACATTPASRIEKQPEAFAALPPEQQQKVREGHVGIGFDAAAVRLAIGGPDRIVARETAEGATEVWVYYVPVALAYPYSPYCAPGFVFYGYSHYCAPLAATQYEERTRVSFKDGKVVTIERMR